MKVIGFAWTPPKRATSSASNSFRLRSRAGFSPARKRQGPKSSRATGSSFVFAGGFSLNVRARLHRSRKYSGNCHSEPRSFFERGEESASFPVGCEKQIPRFARDDKYWLFSTNGGTFRLCWQCPSHRQDARQRRAQIDCPHNAIAAANRRCAPARPGSGTW